MHLQRNRTRATLNAFQITKPIIVFSGISYSPYRQMFQIKVTYLNEVYFCVTRALFMRQAVSESLIVLFRGVCIQCRGYRLRYMDENEFVQKRWC